jgi:hypothetical protein
MSASCHFISDLIALTHLATNIVEVNIKVSKFLAVLVECWALVVEREVDSQRLPQPSAFIFAASDCDDLGTLLLANLAHQRASSTSSTAYNQSLSSFDFADLEETLYGST